MMYHNIFFILMFRVIGNKVVGNWRKLWELGVESSDIVVPETVFLVVVSSIRLAVVCEGCVSHTAVCYFCLLWSKMQHKYFHNFIMMELKTVQYSVEVFPNKLFARYVDKWRSHMNWAMDLRFP